MAKIVTLRNKGTGEIEYPRTLMNAVVDENGNSIDSLIIEEREACESMIKQQGNLKNLKTLHKSNLVDAINEAVISGGSGKGLSTNDFTNSYKQKLDELPPDLVNSTELNELINSHSGLYSDKPVTNTIGFYYYCTDLKKIIWWNGSFWIDDNGNPAEAKLFGTTLDRPSGVNIGFNYFDTDIDRLITWNGTNWVYDNNIKIVTQDQYTNLPVKDKDIVYFIKEA